MDLQTLINVKDDPDMMQDLLKGKSKQLGAGVRMVKVECSWRSVLFLPASVDKLACMLLLRLQSRNHAVQLRSHMLAKLIYL